MNHFGRVQVVESRRIPRVTEDGSTGQVVKSEPAIKHISKFFVGNTDLSDLNVYCYDQESAFKALAALEPDDMEIKAIVI